jgi:hypothetical protein
MSTRLAWTIGVACITTGSTAAFGNTGVDPTLVGTVGARGKITFSHPSGMPVTELRAGAFRFVIKDRSSSHGFRLIDADPNTRDQQTRAAFVGVARWRVVLKPGAYRFMSTGRPSSGGSFRVR